MITLNFKQSPIDLPPVGQDILVISGDNPAFGYAYDSLEQWNCVASTEDGEEFLCILPLDSICPLNKRKDITVSLDSGHSTTLENFLQLKFLWILKSEYEICVHPFSLDKRKI